MSDQILIALCISVGFAAGYAVCNVLNEAES